MVEPSTTLGPYTSGEIPPPLVVTFEDQNEDPIDVTGYDVIFTYRRHAISAGFEFSASDPAAVSQPGVVDPDQVAHKGQASYTWQAVDLQTDGDYEAEMWVGNGGVRMCSIKYVYHVRAALAIPSI